MLLFSGSSFFFESAYELGGCVRIGEFTLISGNEGITEEGLLIVFLCMSGFFRRVKR